MKYEDSLTHICTNSNIYFCLEVGVGNYVVLPSVYEEAHLVHIEFNFVAQDVHCVTKSVTVDKCDDVLIDQGFVSSSQREWEHVSVWRAEDPFPSGGNFTFGIFLGVQCILHAVFYISSSYVAFTG